MDRSLTRLFLILSALFSLTETCATEIYPFHLDRQDGSVLEGYFSPPSTTTAPIIYAIQGSSCGSIAKWHEELSNQAKDFGFGVISLEKQGVSKEKIDLFSYDQTNCIQSRLEDYLLCLENTHLIYPEWEGKPVFWGESEGGMLAAMLANRTSQTAAVLLFATGGGMSPREEVIWALRHLLEKRGDSLDEIDQYMKSVDEQIDAMILDPSSEKHFLGNTFKWWASFLLSEKVMTYLNQQTFPICLVHGVNDCQIPILSADLAADQLFKTTPLTYLRLEGFGHNLDNLEIQQIACEWLFAILTGQQISNGGLVTKIAIPALTSLENKQVDGSLYVFSRGKDREGEGKGEIYGVARGDKDSSGHESYSIDGGVSYDFENGWRGEIRGGASFRKDKEQDTTREAHAEAKVSKGF